MFNFDVVIYRLAPNPRDRSRRQLRPSVEGLEPRLVLSAALTAVQTVQVSDGKDILYDDGSVTFTPDARHPGSTVSAYTGTQNVVQMIAAGGGIVTRFSGGGTYFSPDGRDIGQVGTTVHAYNGTQTIIAMVAVAGGGVDTLFSEGGVYFSPDGMNLGGGGNTVRAYTGNQIVVQMVGAGGGVDTHFDGGGIYFSPDGLNVGGGGNTVIAYTGTEHVKTMVSAGGGVDTLFGMGTVDFSPNGLNLGGGGATTVAADGSQGTIYEILPVAGGVDVWDPNGVYFSPDGLNLFGSAPVLPTSQFYAFQMVSAGVGVDISLQNDFGAIYFSRTGTNLAGGGNSVLVSEDITGVYLASAGGGVDVNVTYSVAGQVYTLGTYFSQDGLNLLGGGDTVSAGIGSRPITAMVSVAGGVDIQFAGATGNLNQYGSVYFSPDGRNLSGGGNSVLATDGSPPDYPLDPSQPPGSSVYAIFPSFAGSDRFTVYNSTTGRNLDGGGSTTYFDTL